MSTIDRVRIAIPDPALAAVCQKYSIARLSVFGSALRDDFGEHSDVDLLVEFDAMAHPTLLTLERVQTELSNVIGRATDVHTPSGLHWLIRDRVLSEARQIYAAR